MRHKTNTRSSLFLMELIIAILFFSLAGAICLRMFAKSHHLSTDASDLNQAVRQADNVAELIKYDLEKGTHTLEDEYPDANIIKNVTGNIENTADMYSSSIIYFDKNWNAVNSDQAIYKLTIQAQDSSDTLRKYTLTVQLTDDHISSDTTAASDTSDDSNCIYELPLSIHIAREVADYE